MENAKFPYDPGKPLEPATLCWTHEMVRGEPVKCQRWFKDFDSPEGYFEAYAKLLATAKVYGDARQALAFGGGDPDPSRVKSFVVLMAPHYATAELKDHLYSKTLLSVMQSNNLYQYDRYALAKVKKA